MNALAEDQDGVEPQRMVLRGLNSYCLTFVTHFEQRDSFVSVYPYFDLEIVLDACAPLIYHTGAYCYGRLRTLLEDLVALRRFEIKEVAFPFEDIYLTLCRHQWGVLEGLIVEGYFSFDIGQLDWQRKEELRNRLLDRRESLFGIDFAFCTTQGDPAYLDDFIADLAELIEANPSVV